MSKAALPGAGVPGVVTTKPVNAVVHLQGRLTVEVLDADTGDPIPDTLPT